MWDFSEGGLGMDSPRELEVGQVVDLEADLHGPAYSMGLQAKARVVYCTKTGAKVHRIGVAFIESSYRRLDKPEE